MGTISSEREAALAELEFKVRGPISPRSFPQAVVVDGLGATYFGDDPPSILFSSDRPPRCTTCGEVTRFRLVSGRAVRSVLEAPRYRVKCRCGVDEIEPGFPLAAGFFDGYRLPQQTEEPMPRVTAKAEAPRVAIPKRQRFSVAALRAPEYNPREISEKELDGLRKGIREFGLVQDLVVNLSPGREGVVVGGFQRLRILQEEGVDEIEAAVVELPIERERELNIRLNANGGRFSGRMLLEAGFSAEDLAAWGMREFDLAAFDRAAVEARTTFEREAAERLRATSAEAKRDSAAAAAPPPAASTAAPLAPPNPPLPPAQPTTAAEFRTMILTGPPAILDPIRERINATQREQGLGSLAEALHALLFPSNGG